MILFADFFKIFDSIHDRKMEQILLFYCMLPESLTAITMLYSNTKVKVHPQDGERDFFDIVAGVLQGSTLTPSLFIDRSNKKWYYSKKRQRTDDSLQKPADADYSYVLAHHEYTPTQPESWLHSEKHAAESIGLHMNANKTEWMYFNREGTISTQKGSSLKLVDKFTYLSSRVLYTKSYVSIRLAKMWTASDKLSIT